MKFFQSGYFIQLACLNIFVCKFPSYIVLRRDALCIGIVKPLQTKILSISNNICRFTLLTHLRTKSAFGMVSLRNNLFFCVFLFWHGYQNCKCAQAIFARWIAAKNTIKANFQTTFVFLAIR